MTKKNSFPGFLKYAAGGSLLRKDEYFDSKSGMLVRGGAPRSSKHSSSSSKRSSQSSSMTFESAAPIVEDRDTLWKRYKAERDGLWRKFKLMQDQYDYLTSNGELSEENRVTAQQEINKVKADLDAYNDGFEAWLERNSNNAQQGGAAQDAVPGI